MFLTIPNNMLQDNKITDIDLAVYCAIEYLKYTPQEEIIFNADYLLYTLFGKLEDNEYFRRKIDTSMVALGEWGYISYSRKQRGLYCVVKPDEPDTFVKIYDYEFLTILRSEQKHKYSLLRYFVQIVRSFYNNKNYGNMPIHYNAEQVGISKPTAVKYNKELEDMELLYVCHSSNKGKNNLYGRYSEKYNMGQDNRKRSLMQKYNWIQRGKKYSPEETEEIRQYIAERNEHQRKLAEKFGIEPDIKPLVNLQ